MRRYLGLAALVTALLAFWWLIRRQGGELDQVWQLLPGLRARFLVAAVALQAAFFADQALVYRELYRVLGSRVPWVRLFWLTLASTFAGRVVPAGNFSTVAVFVEEAAGEGLAPWTSLMNNSLYYLFDYLAFFFFLGLGLVYLAARHQLTRVQVAATLVLGVLVLAALALLVLVALRPGGPLRLAWRLVHWINQLGRRRGRSEVLPAEKVLRGLETTLEALPSLMADRWRLAAVVGLAALLQVVDLGILYCLFQALGEGVTAGVLVAGFGLATLFSLVTFIPNGLGVFATSMAWVYASLGVPWAVATAVALLYRVITFWLPVPAGALSLYLLRKGRRAWQK